MSDSTQSIEQELMDYTSDSLSSASSIIVDTINGSVTVNYESLAADPQAQSMFNLFAGFGIGLFIFLLALVVFHYICYWKVFVKAGQPGWASLVPFYNIYIMFKIVDKPLWWILLLLIPIVNIFFAIKLVHALSKSFGQGVGFTIGLIFLPTIFLGILAFGDATYKNEVLTDSSALDSSI